MAGEKVRVKWVVNCTGEPVTFTGKKTPRRLVNAEAVHFLH